MCYSKLFYLLLLPLCTAWNQPDAKPDLVRWVVESGCSLKVTGTTNVNRFSCTIIDYAKPDTLTFYRGTAVGLVKMNGAIAVDVQQFDCRHQMITRDLRKTLKAEAFPKLTIRFISLNRYPEFNSRQESIKGWVAIELAGVKRQYEVDYTFIPEGTKGLSLVGRRAVKFSDFNLVPPKKAAGMIRTNDLLDVEFNLMMKVL